MSNFEPTEPNRSQPDFTTELILAEIEANVFITDVHQRVLSSLTALTSGQLPALTFEMTQIDESLISDDGSAAAIPRQHRLTNEAIRSGLRPYFFAACQSVTAKNEDGLVVHSWLATVYDAHNVGHDLAVTELDLTHSDTDDVLALSVTFQGLMSTIAPETSAARRYYQPDHPFYS